jgi:lysophospholipase L1-like esterase
MKNIARAIVILAALALCACGKTYQGEPKRLTTQAVAATGPTSVCMVGDSITARGMAWRERMAQQRPDWHYDGSHSDGTYLHDGVGGDTTRDIINRLNAVPACDVYLLMAGGNDLAKRSATPGQIAENLQSIADTLSARGGVVFLMTMIPCNCGTEGNIEIAYTNYLIQKNITGHAIIDAWSAFSGSPYPKEWLYVDAFHPSWLGYRVLADFVAPRVTG